MRIDTTLTASRLVPKAQRLFQASAGKLRSLERDWCPEDGAPVFTAAGRWSSQGWTDWTQGFQFGSGLLQFEATGEEAYYQTSWEQIRRRMASHVSHQGVHDHGFNNVSTFGNVLRLMASGRIEGTQSQRDFCELAIKVSGAVQAARWAPIQDGRGYIYSFNGPHSLFADTIRSLRSLALAHRLDHELKGEQDQIISLLRRMVEHAQVTAEFTVYYGEGRDLYDVAGRVAHESLFNPANGSYRCPSTQQGYSPFSTWTRGLAWILCGYAELLEFLVTVPEAELEAYGGRNKVESSMRRAAETTAEFYIQNSAADGIPYWDTGAPGLSRMGDYLGRSSDPFNEWEPVDSSAAAISAQGLWRLGSWLMAEKGQNFEGQRYRQAALTVADTLFSPPYLSEDPDHQGLILHSVYHRPRGWDYIPPGRRIPCGEASMWGDYHARELGLLILREAEGSEPAHFFDIG